MRKRYIHAFIAALLCGAASLTLRAGTPAQLVSARSTAISLPAGGNADSVDPQLTPDGRYVLFNSAAGNLAPGAAGQICTQVYLRDRLNNNTTLVSVNLNGFGGNSSSTYGGVSPDGRYVVFQSDAADLVPGDTNGYSDIFVRDLLAQTTTLASVSTAGIEGNRPSYSPVITPDGRYVAFISLAYNLVPGQPVGAIPGVFVRDLLAQTTTLVTVGAAFYTTITTSIPAITPDGRYVAFMSTATNLVSGVTQFGGEIYVRDLLAGQTIWVSTNASATAKTILGTSATPASQHPVISDDGSLVTFKTGLPTDSARGVIFQVNVTNLSSVLIATNTVMSPAYGDDSYGPEMSPNGQFVAFASSAAPSLNGTNYTSILLWNAQTALSTNVSANTNGLYSPFSFSITPALDSDGRYVAFLSSATDLTSNSLSPGLHIFLRDTLAGTTSLMDVDPNGLGSADFTTTGLSLSANGQFLAFCGPDGSLVPGDTNAAYDVFLRNIPGATTELISQRNPAIPVRSGNLLSFANPPSISADGRWVAFSSYATDLVPNDTNALRDVFLYDRWIGGNLLVSVDPNGGPALGGNSFNPLISTNGRYVIFLSAATNLTALPTTNIVNVYRRDLQSQTTVLVSVATDGSPGSGDSSSPVISQDGRYVSFLTKAQNIAPGIPVGRMATLSCDIDGGTATVLNSNSVFNPTMSKEGRYVAYSANSAFSKVLVWDTQLATNTFTNAASSAAISPDGNRLLYQAGVSNVVRDLLNGTNMLIFPGNQKIPSSSIWSGDGRFVAIVTTNAISIADQNKTNDVYLADLQAGVQTLVSVNSTLTGTGNAASDSPAVSWDGRFVVFRSFSTNLVPGDTNAPDLFVFDTATGSNSLLNSQSAASDTFTHPSNPAISADSGTAVFQSLGSGLTPGDINRAQDVFAAVLPGALTADSDADGIPDWWLIQYFGHANGLPGDQSLAQDHPIANGLTTLQDYLAGFVLYNGASAPFGGGFNFIWLAVPGETYQVQYKNNLTDPNWLPFAAIVVNNNLGQFTAPAGQPDHFYRIVAQ